MSAPPPPASSDDDAKPVDEEGVEIREVWATNLEAEFAVIRDVVDDYSYIAMDTEFPGIVCRPLGSFRSNDEYNYATLKANVDMLSLIQLGLTLSDENGALPARGTGGRPCAWQFNFRGFDPRSDPANADSIDLLRNSGIEFDRFTTEGADTGHFAELLMSSGVLLNAEVQWVTFHSGIYFPVLYDIKHLMKYCGSLHGGLSKLGELLGVQRVGICHQAGSDSLLTLQCFKKLKEVYFRGSTENYAGVLYGLISDGGENRPPAALLIE
ncbi:hypothetical protein ZWY2020_035726 [Hordeum vulgare]|nr:hypothetical protein ZWY2020_035726 [Hordeum vulgare]